ncbi:hypothetical protein [Allosphingosinicella sp.]|jgi:hypothetical protein|uniref:hypothetical protein n=1 Tax=Allosphingosinicella sp. TaxID=2823234 RepID=UPI002F181813
MKSKRAAFLLIPLLVGFAASAGAASLPPEQPRARFEGLFTDWSAVNRQSVEAEREAQSRPAPQQPAPYAAASSMAGTSALGERVGEIVATGDCAEGERIARLAGDFALVAAVRNHCYSAAPQPR